MVTVGFCSYWGLGCCCGCWFDGCCCLLFSGYFYTTVGLLSLYSHGGCAGILQIVIVSLPVIQGRAGFAACGQKSMCIDAGAFSIPRFDLVLDLVLDLIFFPLSETHPAAYKTRKRACFAFFVCGR